MGQKYVTVDGTNIVQEPYDEDNGNVPGGALPITEVEFKQLAQGFDLFKHEGGILVPNVAGEEAKLRLTLIGIERSKAVEALITAQKVQIANMPKVALEAAIAAGGLG